MLKQLVLLVALLPTAGGVIAVARERAVVNDDTALAVVAPNTLAIRTCAHHRAPPVRRRRRAVDSTDVDGISSSTLALASEFLRAQSSGNPPDASARSAWQEFHGWCARKIARFSSRLGLRGADADDCSQEVWGDLLRNFKSFQLDSSRGRFSSWLYTVVRNKATDLVRRRARRRSFAKFSLAAAKVVPVADGQADPAVQCERACNQQTVRRMLERLRSVASEQSYRVLHLRWIEQLEAPEVARRLGITPEQVWVREHRMKRKLRDLFVAAATTTDDFEPAPVSLALPLHARGGA